MSCVCIPASSQLTVSALLIIYLKSLGERNKIQVSQSTADLIIVAGKRHWLKSRQGGVTAKGKGVLNTFWLNPSAKKGSSSYAASEASSTGDTTQSETSVDPKQTAEAIVKQGRLVSWIVELLLDHVKKIVSRRLPTGSLSSSAKTPDIKSYTCRLSSNLLYRSLDAMSWESRKAKPLSYILSLKERHAWTRFRKLSCYRSLTPRPLTRKTNTKK
jgi:hypothetical protein